MHIRPMILLVLILGILSCGPASAWKQNKFFVTVWCSPPATDEALSRAAAEGYDLVWVPADKLDIVAKYKMKALIQDEALISLAALDDPAKKAKLVEMIEKVKKHPALEGYFIVDEPGSGAFQKLRELADLVRAHDPKHLFYVNLLPTYATEEQLGVTADEADKAKVGIPSNFAGIGDFRRTALAYAQYLDQFVSVVKPELISYDHYHFLKGADGGQYFLNLGLVREESVKKGIPFLNIIQASTLVPSWRLVNKDELRWLVFTTMAYGGRGISYFLYWGPTEYGGLYQDGKRMPLATDVAAINSELQTIGPEMMKLRSAAVYHTTPIPAGGVEIPEDSPVKITGGSFVLGLFEGKGPKVDSFMIVNRDYNRISVASLTLADSIKSLEEFNRVTGKWEAFTELSNHSVSVILQPGNGRLFRMIQGRM